MSSSTEGIPIRRLVVHDPKDMPLQYGETPGGSVFSTTPGGTRIYYDRAFLLSRRDSPMTRSPPNLPFIPEVTLIPDPSSKSNAGTTGVIENGTASTDLAASVTTSSTNVISSSATSPTNPPANTDEHGKTSKKGTDDQFPMDI